MKFRGTIPDHLDKRLFIASVLLCALALFSACSESANNNDLQSKRQSQAGAESTTLATQLDALRARNLAEVPPVVLQITQRQKDILRESHIVDKALRGGDKAPEFSLPNANGEDVSLASLLQQGPVVLTFYRGAWCPYCNLQLAALQEFLPQFRSAGAQLVAISPESPENAMMVKNKNKLEFEVLSDRGSAVAHQFGVSYQICSEMDSLMANHGMNLRQRNSCEKAELPLAATYVIGQDGVIRWAYLNEDYTYRAEPKEILDAMKTM